ncbi:ISAs1 family transposase [Pontibacter sp. HSC-14F20]|nr:ISAs1 family transposase [Pontibacter sp. HSC-14F20]
MPKKTARLIVSHRQHYLIKVKGNQSKLLSDIKQAAAQGSPVGRWQESERCRGREVRRTLELFAASAKAKAQWPGLAWYVRLVRRGRRKGQDYERSSYYICSLKKAEAAQLAQVIRGHWGIENRVHWEKDVTLGEDGNGIYTGQAPENLSLLKSMALNIARKSGFQSMKEAITAFANKIDLITKLIRT